MLLTDAVLLRNMLSSTPLTPMRSLIEALYFIFMPAAILGTVPGIAGTAILAGVAAYFWLWGEPGSLDSFLWFWLIWAAVDWVLLQVFRTIMGVCEYRQFKAFLQAEADCGTVDLRPGGSLKIALEQGESRKLPLVVQVPQRGVYVLKVSVAGGNSRVKVGFDGCACMEEHECEPGLVNAHAAVYRLESGCHCLNVLVQAGSNARLNLSFR